LTSAKTENSHVKSGAASLQIGSIFVNAARAVPDRTAVVLNSASLTFAQLNCRANQMASALLAIGIRRGDRLVTWCPTSLELTTVFAAASKIGVVFAPANYNLGEDEVAVMIESARPSLVLVGVDTNGAGHLATRSDYQVITMDEMARRADIESDAEPVSPAPAETDPHVIFFTSGSTGQPKGAVLSHRVNYLRSHPGSQLEHRGPMVCPFPLFHMGAWTIALQQWQCRDAIVLLSRADARDICQAIVRHRAERLNCIPAVWRRILDFLSGPEGRELDLSSVRFADTGTSATPRELLQEIAEACPGANVRVFYGSTEAGSVASLDHDDIARKPGCCGVPANSTVTRIAAGGELQVKGPLVFTGYFENPEATDSVFEDGWYRTGDLAEVDDDGYLSIIGRTRDIIRTGGGISGSGRSGVRSGYASRCSRYCRSRSPRPSMGRNSRCSSGGEGGLHLPDPRGAPDAGLLPVGQFQVPALAVHRGIDSANLGHIPGSATTPRRPADFTPVTTTSVLGELRNALTRAVHFASPRRLQRSRSGFCGYVPGRER
jgi:fatty-acyl-CoA synthase